MSGVRTILGCLEFGRFHSESLEVSESLLTVFLNEGFKELDTAFMYNGGKSEELMGLMPACHDDSKVSIATKANPWSDEGLKYHRVIEELDVSLKRLQRDHVDLFYLHAPDHNTPIEETLRAVNQLHKDGKFKEFGLSNYAAWQVAEIYYICKANDWVLPTVYQGMYNAITRSVEKELFPCLKRFGIRFYAYNPLAGGLLTGKYKMDDKVEEETVGRFAGSAKWAVTYRDRYWNKTNFEQMDNIKKKLDRIYGEGKVSLAEASLRWMYHHSKLSGDIQDGVILGAGKLPHLQENLKASKSEPLHQEIVDAFDEAWVAARGSCPDYMR